MIHQHGTFVSAAAAAEASIRQVLISGIAPSKPLPPLTVRLLHGRLLRLELLADLSHYLLRALSSSGLHLHALSLHSLFPDPSHLTLPFALKSASRLPNALPVGEQLHARSLKLPSHSNPHVLTSLLSLYAKCGLLDHARAVLDEMRCPHAVSWTALIAAYMNAGRNKEAVDTARDAFASGMRPDSFTATRLLTACARTVDLDTVEAVWRVADREGIATNLFMATAAVNLYIKGGEMAKAREVFDKMPHKDALAWGAMVKGYASNGYSQEAVELFFAMQTHGVTPDCYTVAGALSACTRLGALDLGRQVVGVVEWDEFLDNPVLGTALIDMYAKCGSTWDAWVVFWQMRERDIIVWNTMIFGLRMAGYGKAAFAIVAHMLKSGMQLCSVDMDWVGMVVALESANTSPATNRSGGGGGIRVANRYVFKHMLHEYAQKAGLMMPEFQTLREGPSHEPIFKSTVLINNSKYESLPGSFSWNSAEESAAAVALMEIGKSLETGRWKILLQEYAQKMNYAMPSYICNKQISRVRPFRCTVEIGGTQYIGGTSLTKKQAEMKAARTALRAIQGVGNRHVFKCMLQEYAQKAGLMMPEFQTLREGPSHEPIFKSTVLINNAKYESLPGFFSWNSAEESAAEVALMEIGKSVVLPTNKKFIKKNDEAVDVERDEARVPGETHHPSTL